MSPVLRPHVDAQGRGPRWLAPLAVALIWGVNVPVMKGALGSIEPVLFNALRLTASAVALGVADRFERRGAPVPPTPWKVVLGLGLLTSLLYQVLFIAAMDRTSAIHSGFLVASGPLWTAGLARLSGLERPSGRAWIGLGLAFLGTSLLVLSRGGDGPASEGATLVGNLMMVGAMITWALGSVLSRPVLTDFPPTRLAFLSLTIVLPGHWLLALPHLGALVPGAETAPGPAGWAAVLFSGVFSTGLAYSFWNLSLRRIGPARTSAWTNLVPVVALAVAWAALGERPGPLQLLGGALILLGLTGFRSARSAPAPAPAKTA